LRAFEEITLYFSKEHVSVVPLLARYENCLMTSFGNIKKNLQFIVCGNIQQIFSAAVVI
jgi:hypothetical protein